MKRTSNEKVTFCRPDLKSLKEQGCTAVDMHFHTNHSDSPTKVKSAIKYAKKLGAGVAVTDHNEIGGSIEAFNMDRDVLVVPGIEVSAADGPHILLYFYDISEMTEFYSKEIEKEKSKSPYLAINLSSEEIIDRADRYNCVKVPAHPYGYLLFNKGLQKCIEGRWIDPKLLERFQGIEAISGGMTHALNVRAMDLAVKCGKGVTGGSDGHLLHDLGTVVTSTPSQDLEEHLDHIVGGNSNALGHEKNIVDKCYMGSVVMTKYLRYALPSLQVHYKQNMPRIRRYLSRTKS